MDDRRQSSFGGWATAALLAVLSTMVDPLFAGATTSGGWLVNVTVALVSCQFSLLAIWLGLGNSSFLIRILTAAPAGFLLAWLFCQRRSWGFGQHELLFGYMLVVPVMSLPSFAMRAVGFRVGRANLLAERQSNGRPFQYTLGQAFTLTIVAALAALSVRVCTRVTDVASDETSWEALERPTLRLTMAWLSCIAIASPVVAWTVLSSQARVMRRLAPLAIVSIVLNAAAVGAVLQITVDYRTAPVDWEHIIQIAVPFAAIAIIYLALATSALFFVPPAPISIDANVAGSRLARQTCGWQ